ncbi:MAG: Low molecular weight phosphotyrosine protein phosphatase [uncultured bacterium]|nr:MAG: Low molecular weight phosphotyrosine protein phosphatase [uncultured bacterium]
MSKEKIIFVCIHNSARSQMAEAFMKKECSDYFDVFSAGLEPGKLNPDVVQVMNEIGIDISKNQTKSINDFINEQYEFSYVVTVCDETSAERCPVFPGNSKRLHWGFEDPSSLKGDKSEILAHTRKIRNQIEMKIKEFCEEICCIL